MVGTWQVSFIASALAGAAGYHRLVSSAGGARLGVAAARRLARLCADEIAPGLTDAEIARVERDYGFEFADDHRAFLAAGLPVNAEPHMSEEGSYRSPKRPWPDWRNGDPDEIRSQIDWPIRGILFDVEHDVVWHATWGDRPADLEDALAKARVFLARVPRLVPVFAHRYLPSGRGAFGHPVLSIYQSDIVIYGPDLDDYIEKEFGSARRTLRNALPPSETLVPFWRDFL
jgi:hypothetical protein